MADPQQPDSGQEPDDENAPGGAREQDDQQNDEPEVDPEVRRLRAEAKRLRLERNELRDKTKQYEDRDKSEQQRQQDELTSATKRAEAAELRLLKHEVAAKYNVSQHAGRLQGETRDELVADAKALAQEFGVDGPDGQSNGFSSGVRRSVPKRPATMDEFILRSSGR